MKKVFGLAVLALFLSTNSWAEDSEHCGCSHSHWYQDMHLAPSWYAGASFAQNTFSNWSFPGAFNDGSFTSAQEDDRDTGLGIFAGVDFLKYFALEAGYVDFGEATFRAQSNGSGSAWAAGPVTDSLSLKGYDLNLIGKLRAFKSTALFARVGALQTEKRQYTTGSKFGGAFTSDGDSTRFSYGAGIEYDGFRPLRLDAGYSTAVFGPMAGWGDSRVGSFGLSLAYLF